MLETAFDYFCARYNILWWEKECWFIDVSQAVEPIHPSGLDFLFRLSSFSGLQVDTLTSVSYCRDCTNISTFFSKHGVDTLSPGELFSHVSGLETSPGLQSYPVLIHEYTAILEVHV